MPRTLEPTGMQDNVPVDGDSLARAMHDPARQFTSVTGADGAFSVDAIAFHGVAVVRGEADGWIPVSNSIDLAAGEHRSELLLALSPGVTVRGSVHDPVGAPVTDATVQLVGLAALDGMSFGRSPDPLQAVPVDQQGQFELAVPAFGLASVHARSASAGAFTFSEIPIEDGKAIALQYPAAARLHGRITGYDGIGLEGWTLTVKGQVFQGYEGPEGSGFRVGSPGKTYTVLTGAGGDYQIGPIDPEVDYRADLSDESGTLVAQDIEVGRPIAGEAKTWNYSVSDPVTVRGIVYGAGTQKPLAGVAVRCMRRGSVGGGAVAQTDVDGAYILRVLSGPGAYTVTPVYSMAGSPQGIERAADFGRELELVAGRDMTLDLELPEPHSRRFRVTDAAGAPIPGVQVSVRYQPPDGGWYSFGPAGETDGDGGIHVAGLTPDVEMSCVFSKDGYVEGQSRTSAGLPGEEIAEELIVLYPPSSVAGIAVDASGAPLRDRMVWLHLQYGAGQHSDVAAVTDDQGVFEVQNMIPATEIELYVTESQTERGDVAPESGDTPYTVECLPGAVTDLGVVRLVSGSAVQ